MNASNKVSEASIAVYKSNKKKIRIMNFVLFGSETHIFAIRFWK